MPEQQATYVCQGSECPSGIFGGAVRGVKGMVAVNCTEAGQRVNELGGQAPPCGFQLMEAFGIAYPDQGGVK